MGYGGDGGPAYLGVMNTPTGVAVDGAGNMYIADCSNQIIRKVSNSSTPIITTYAGTPLVQGYSGDGGPATAAKLNTPNGVAVDAAGNLYISEQYGQRIRKVDATTGIITTVAGTGTGGYSGDNGPAIAAKINTPGGVCVNSDGSIFIADQSNNVIREVSKATTVTISAFPGNNICDSTPVSYTANVSNAVLGESFQWSYNGANAGADTPVYSNNTLVNGDQVYCTLSFPAPASTLAVSDTIIMTVNPILIPLLSISNDTNNVCAGIPVVFTAAAVNGGTAPVYEWFVNGSIAHIGNPYTYDPVNGDIVNCLLTSNAMCAIPDTASGSNISMLINADVIMNISATSLSGDSILSGELTTFIAEPTNEGATPTYQWFINGIAVTGATSNIFSTTGLNNNDTVTCVLTGSLPCTLPATDTSAPLIIKISNLAVANTINAGSAFTLLPNPNNGSFTLKGTFNNTSTSEIKTEVINMLGQTVCTGTTATTNGIINEHIALGGQLPNGLYQLHIISGNRSETIPFIVGK